MLVWDEGCAFGGWRALTWIGWQHMLRLRRDHYLRMDGNDYAAGCGRAGGC